MKKRFFSFTLFLLICLSIPSVSTAATVNIPDPNLHAAVKKALGKKGANITEAKMAKLTRLNAPNKKISDLTGLEYAINLQVLKLARNRIKDISPLAGLTHLTELGFYQNRIKDISPLEGLTNLQQLNLRDNRITDISPLRGLTNLQVLNLRQNKITNIIALVDNAERGGLGQTDTVDLRGNPLDSDAITNYVGVLEQYGVTVQWDPPDPASNVVNIPDAQLRASFETALSKAAGDPITQAEMETLTNFYPANHFSSRQVSDLTGLEYAINLTRLSIETTGTIDISPIGALTKLKMLDFTVIDGIIDLSPLAKLTQLTELFIMVDRITDISPLAKLTNLTELRLVHRNITDLSPLAKLTKLTWLRIHSYENRSTISDISPLAKLTKLKELSILGNRIENVSPLAVLANLTVLNIGSNRISDISPLAGLTNLTKLYIGGNRIRDISALSKLTNLTWLFSDENYIEDISSLAGLTNLTLLQLSRNGIIDISPVAGLTNLELLSLHRSSRSKTTFDDNRSLTDISPVSKLTRLRRLDLGENTISDISPLAGLTNLTELSLHDNSITDISVIAKFTKIEDLWLADNRITDISPLVANTGLGRGDRLLVWENPLDADSINTHIPALKSRGVDVTFEGTSAAPSIARPMLALSGTIVDQPSKVNGAGFRITVKNLSNDQAAMTIDTDGQGYQLEVEPGQPGNILLISAQSPDPSISVKSVRYTLTAEDVLRGWIQLPALVVQEMPKETELLANYPNPFNPETWIPYRLAEDADVKLTIYDSKGQVVRSLDVGHQVTGVYESRSKAVYFDGRNASGEPVSSGVYFYHLSAGDYSATRRLLILK